MIILVQFGIIKHLKISKIACEQAPSEVGKKFGKKSERLDSTSEASGARGSL